MNLRVPAVLRKYILVLCLLSSVQAARVPVWAADGAISPAEVRQRVVVGNPLSPRTQALLQKITDVPITIEGLQDLYRDVFRKGKVVVKLREDTVYGESQTFGFFLHFLSREGEKKGNAHLQFSKLSEEDDRVILEIVHIEIADARYRGAVVSRLLQATVGLLQTLSSSKDAKISLQAMTTVGYHGAYLWATYGFDFDNGVMHSRAGYLKDLREAFFNWLVRLELTTKEQAKIRAVAERWDHSWEMANFDATPLLGRSVGKFKGKIGKQFLGDSNAEADWYGSLFVNQPGSPGMQQYYRRQKEDQIKAALQPEKDWVVEEPVKPGFWTKLILCGKYLTGKMP